MMISSGTYPSKVFHCSAGAPIPVDTRPPGSELRALYLLFCLKFTLLVVVPCVHHIPGGMYPGKMIRVQGSTPPGAYSKCHISLDLSWAIVDLLVRIEMGSWVDHIGKRNSLPDMVIKRPYFHYYQKVHRVIHCTDIMRNYNLYRFAINLQCGPNTDPRDDIALHINFRFPECCVVRNHLSTMSWGPEETAGGLPINRGESFEALILCEPNSIKIALNGIHFCEFIHRLPYQRITHITVDGDVMLTFIGFEGAQSAPPGQYMQPGYAPPAYGAPPPAYGAPGYGPPQALGRSSARVDIELIPTLFASIDHAVSILISVPVSLVSTFKGVDKAVQCI
ncbi:Galectin-4 [Eumeta japonica]|uniref:Galectin n=1 Tax=Eumeta variegata TaxID=151549 RepID=A0A4C1UM14_EUMVA|nr:Galectin-4 [Eumeta japonica]